jgi:hypothetical protein
MRSLRLIGWLAPLCAPGCAEPPPISDPVLVVPSDGLPPEAAPMRANNNLDVVRHDGRVFLAFRSAASHFAGPEALMLVVSSGDERRWTFEARVALGTDVREPRFLSWNGRLFLYFAVLGAEPTAFEPQGTRVIERTGPGAWTAPEDVYQPGFIPWRTKVVGGTPYLVAYVGGERIYDGDGAPLEVHWLTTDDGRSWRPVVPGRPAVLVGGASETDFVFLDDGALVAVARNEAGDASGWGSKICRAEPGAIGEWRCASDPRKYDSPLLFRRRGGVYLLARRHLSESGHYDLMLRDLPAAEQTLRYQVAYSLERKRCSLWRVDPEALTVSFVLDLPSHGDTCFPAILDEGDQAGDTAIVYNYSSPLDGGDDLTWFAAQSRPTHIYRMLLRP